MEQNKTLEARIEALEAQVDALSQAVYGKKKSTDSTESDKRCLPGFNECVMGKTPEKPCASPILDGENRCLPGFNSCGVTDPTKPAKPTPVKGEKICLPGFNECQIK